MTTLTGRATRPAPGTSAVGAVTAALKDRRAVLPAAAVLVLVLLWAAVPGLFTAADPLRGVSEESLQPPSAQHWFGTDRLGRDLFTRVVHGTRTTLTATFLAVLVGGLVGALLGLVSGFVRGWPDAVLMRVVDVLLAIPGLLLAMTVVTALGHGTNVVAIAVGVAAVPSFARVMRSEVLRVVGTEYVEAAYLTGGRRLSVLWQHVLPNAARPVLALAALEFGAAVLAVASLGFLGYGAPPPQPEWGLLVVEGKDLLASHPWVSLLPGLVIALTVLSANRLSNALGRMG
ncbi:ABC transporter permease [Georgenia subflava]|uniref:ABC transporter permease subunit n=1 Tax=Georgenia subflava TaxID=1622177 RepID=A0A6N7EEC1_9MICO|nr:ABC transporter permease [Georgenia subflava]MPV35681.1 ABC transporter permease subunit [Georgenia subflava]